MEIKLQTDKSSLTLEFSFMAEKNVSAIDLSMAQKLQN